jgi:hypothetical protein
MKRSHAVVAVIAAASVGTAAYSMMPSERCVRADGGATLDPSSPACRGVRGSGGSYFHGGRPLFGSSDASAPTSTKSATSVATTRGGFGSFFSSLGSSLARGT